MTEKAPYMPPEVPRSDAQADLGGGMYTLYREGGFAGPEKPTRSHTSTPRRHTRKQPAPVGPIRGESEADTGPPVYYEAPQRATPEEVQVLKQGVAAAKETLRDIESPRV